MDNASLSLYSTVVTSQDRDSSLRLLGLIHSIDWPIYTSDDFATIDWVDSKSGSVTTFVRKRTTVTAERLLSVTFRVSNKLAQLLSHSEFRMSSEQGLLLISDGSSCYRIFSRSAFNEQRTSTEPLLDCESHEVDDLSEIYRPLSASAAVSLGKIILENCDPSNFKPAMSEYSSTLGDFQPLYASLN